MADEDTKTNAPSDGAPEEKGKQKVEQALEKVDWDKVTNGKFKSAEDVAKAWSEREGLLGKQSEEVRQSREFMETINPLLEEIRNDPEVFNKLDERLRKRGQPSTPTNAETTNDEKTKEMRESAQKLILAKFEEKYGISKLSTEDQVTMRHKIGGIVTSLSGTDFNHVDLRRLDDVLENAYIIANTDKSKLAVPTSEAGEGAAIPGLSSSSEKGVSILTPEEAKAADKMGLSREQYLEGKKKLAK